MLFVDIVVKSALSAGFLKLAKRYPDSITTAGLLRKLSASCWQLVSSGCRRQSAYLPHVWGTYNYDVLYRASDHARTTLGPRMPHLFLFSFFFFLFLFSEFQ